MIGLTTESQKVDDHIGLLGYALMPSGKRISRGYMDPAASADLSYKHGNVVGLALDAVERRLFYYINGNVCAFFFSTHKSS